MTVPPIELKRHYRRLSDHEADGVVGSVAELIVDFLKDGRQAGRNRQGRTGTLPSSTEAAKRQGG
jgi:hypothetical protein